MIKVEVKEEEKGLSDFVDDMVLFREDPTDTQAVVGIVDDLEGTKGRLTSIGQVLNDSKEQVFMPSRSIKQLWNMYNRTTKGKWVK
eukprot:8073791-Heterocapsa_arctica.AAC.1